MPSVPCTTARAVAIEVVDSLGTMSPTASSIFSPAVWAADPASTS